MFSTIVVVPLLETMTAPQFECVSWECLQFVCVCVSVCVCVCVSFRCCRPLNDMFGLFFSFFRLCFPRFTATFQPFSGCVTPHSMVSLCDWLVGSPHSLTLILLPVQPVCRPIQCQTPPASSPPSPAAAWSSRPFFTPCSGPPSFPALLVCHLLLTDVSPTP